MVMLPSLAAAKPLLYTRRPISQICSFNLYSFMILSPCCQSFRGGADVNLIEDAGTVGIHGHLFGVERGRRLAALAEGDQGTEAGTEIVVQHEILAVAMLALREGF